MDNPQPAVDTLLHECHRSAAAPAITAPSLLTPETQRGAADRAAAAAARIQDRGHARLPGHRPGHPGHGGAGAPAPSAPPPPTAWPRARGPFRAGPAGRFHAPHRNACLPTLQAARPTAVDPVNAMNQVLRRHASRPNRGRAAGPGPGRRRGIRRRGCPRTARPSAGTAPD